MRVEGLSSAVKVFVSDGTGEVILFVWRNVLDRIADNTGLGTPGSRVGFHPTRTAALTVDEEIVGHAGELHSFVREPMRCTWSK